MPEKQLTEVSDATEALQTRLDELMSPIHFQELLRTAEDVCLTRTPHYPGEFSLVGEVAIVAKIGTRGIKAALELQHSIPSDKHTVNHEFEDEFKRPITFDTPIRVPQRFSESADFSIIAKAEAFGGALMAESFRTLGQDAYEKVAAFKNATSKEDQLAVMFWLDKRLDAMTHLDNPDSGEDVEDNTVPQLYHPTRLSPKLIGVYPNQNLEPTCLSVSVIAAEFFRRAGADVMHADVARRGIEHTQASTALYISSLEAGLKKRFGMTLPHALSDSLRHVLNQTVASISRNESHHAAVYVGLLDGTWAQFDSNFASTVPIRHKDSNEELTKCYKTITEMKAYAPGTEITHQIMGNMALSDMALEILGSEEPLTIFSIVEPAITELLNEDTESIGQRIYDNCIVPFFASTSENERLNKLKRVIRSSVVESPPDVVEDGLQAEFYKLFEKYVLWGDSAESVVMLAQKDHNYLINRVVDIATLPFTLMATLSSRESKESGYFQAHSIVELGLPEQRIGLAVLSDFAAYTDPPLTPSFWMSNWPGHVSVMENINGAEHSKYQDALVYNNIVYRELHPLTSLRNYDIIRSFLDPRQMKEDETHGKDKEG